MGMEACCRKSEGTDTNQQIFSNQGNKNQLKSKQDKTYNVNPYGYEQNPYGYEQNPYNYEQKENGIKKIQKKYKSYKLKQKYKEEIIPVLREKSVEALEHFYNKCNQGEEINTDDDFSYDGYKQLYPEDERFFLTDRGREEVFPNQIRIYNPDDLDRLEIYEGEINMDNKRSGHGKLTTPYFVRKGTWRNDEFTGWGKEYRRNGDTYEGKFIAGNLIGKGFFTNKKGNKYIGEFNNFKREGEGDLTTESFHYRGEFKNNKLNGKGEIELFDKGHKFKGDFVNNEICGNGTFTWKNGDVYEGEMSNGKMNGYGVYKYKNGEEYQGMYVNGLKEGNGKLIYPDGKTFEGQFRNGLPEGKGLFFKDGKTSKVMYSQGKIEKIIQ